ncbi:hypothetical protein [Chengkuizengella axinellae]|uniref:Uncharacterized protein n=1 Tax=Chengkuizengella axinellae TaxID=3064388 RepID=A0ABT9IYD7_9BACL|nr:hypothetical protein [Chengkuizengella sp. 2205SS18-9]MDP5274372.1 hypothetical protein [Chengkuizengella sp. 2205SS18-9]
MGRCKVCNNTQKMIDPCPEEDCKDGIANGSKCDVCKGKGSVYNPCRYCYYKIKPSKRFYEDEIEDDEEEYEEEFNFKKLFWGVAIFTAFYYFVVRDPAAVSTIENQYEIISVYKGAIQAYDSSGNIVQFFDNNLVNQALNGSLKQGDVIKVK